MKQFVKGISLFVVVCICCFAADAQNDDKKITYLQLRPQRAKISSAIFSNVEVIDTRIDTTLGFIQKGGFNRKVSLLLMQPMKDELASIVKKMLDGAATMENTLLINVREFRISELTAGLSEKGTFAFNARFYIKQGSTYKFMFGVDSAVTVRAGGDLDVTTRLLDTVPEVFAGYINQAATFNLEKAGTKQYTAADIQHIDELEKKEIPVYNVDVPKKGLYVTYEDFRNNRPSREDIIVYHKKGFSRPFVYEMKEDNKKGKEIPSKSYYVVCDGEKMYVGRPKNLYVLTKTNGDFYFTGIGKDEADAGTMLLAGALGGIAGSIAGSHDTAIFEFKIDHLTGKFIPVKKIKD